MIVIQVNCQALFGLVRATGSQPDSMGWMLHMGHAVLVASS